MSCSRNGFRVGPAIVFIAIAALPVRSGASVLYDATHNGEYRQMYSAVAPNSSWGDDLTMDLSIPPAERVIRQVSFAFVVPENRVVPDCDAIVTFYDTEDGGAAGTTPALRDPLGAIRLHIGMFDPSPAPRSFVLEALDIPAQIPGGILMPDGSGGVSVRFVHANSNPPENLAQPSISCALAFDPNTLGGVPNVGTNHLDYFYDDGRRNNSGYTPAIFDGIYTGEERAQFPPPFANFLWLRLTNDDVCAGIIRGDANGDGVVNQFDIDSFVIALVDGGCDNACRCSNDINRDGVVNNYDIDPFVQCLTQSGCP